MVRLTRAESQAQTREQLIRTARRLFLGDGFLGTSLEKVAAEAGYSKGAVYSNFASKFQLGFAVLERIHDEQLGRLRAELADGRTVEDLVDGFARWADANIGNQEWTLLELEFVTGSRNNPVVRRQVAERRREMAARFTAVLEEQRVRLGLQLPMSVEEATAVALTMGVGVGVQRAVDPDVSVRPVVDLLRSLAGGTTAPVPGAHD